jgi:hypothetical protein
MLLARFAIFVNNLGKSQYLLIFAQIFATIFVIFVHFASNFWENVKIIFAKKKIYRFTQLIPLYKQARRTGMIEKKKMSPLPLDGQHIRYCRQTSTLTYTACMLPCTQNAELT